MATPQVVPEDLVEDAKAAMTGMEGQVDYVFTYLDVDVAHPGLHPLRDVQKYTEPSFEATIDAVQTFLRSEKVVGLSVARK